MNEPSRFLDDIDESFLEQTTRRVTQKDFPGQPIMKKAPVFVKKPLSKIENTDKQAESLPSTPPELIQPGAHVEHERFGRGKVISVEGSGPNIKATVFFNAVGQKQLLLKFAKLRLIG
jgi:DNA helicase-2/ATP-dependent DNA helicase PcrA